MFFGMSFGLTNTSTTFISLMNLDSFIIEFIDDILIYSQGDEEH